MSASPTASTDNGRLRGLHPGRVLDMAIDFGSPGLPPGAQWEVPAAEELAALLPEYDVQAIIGRGGMGAVYRAVQKKLARNVAIKVLPVKMGDTPGFADRFRREAMTTAGLTHPDIVAVYDTGETVAGHLYYVMEFVDGEDLAHRMARGLLPVEESVPLVTAVCRALEAAHARGIVHRDLKPSNILLTKEGKPKLADFGLALLMQKNLEQSRLTMGGTTLGTLEYASPEQLAGAGVTPAGDIYSLGVLSYELLTGELPRGVFDPPSVRNPAVDAAFDGVVLRALQSDPARRYEKTGEFCAAMANAADLRAQQARREAGARRRLRQRTRVAAVAAGVALLTIGMAVFAWQQRRRAEAGESAANERRTAAEAAEKETEDVIQFLLTDLRKRLEATGNLGAMESVLERAVVHFRKKYDDSGHTPDAAVQLADALVVKGDVIAVRGLPEEAYDLFTEALTLTESARDKGPDKPGRRLRVARALRDRSEQGMTMGRFSEALDDARLMLREAEQIQNPPAPRTVAAAHRAIANALGYLKQLDECRAEYLKARDILAAEMKLHPESKSLAAEHADFEMSLGSLAEEQQDYPLMLRHFTAWHEFVKGAHSPDSNTYSHAAVRLGHALVLNNRAGEAIPLLADAVRIAESEVDARPGHRGNLSHLRWCLKVNAMAQEQRGEHASAAELRRRMEAIDAAISAAPEEEAAGSRDRVSDRLKNAEQTHFDELKANPEDAAAQYAWAMSSEDVGKHIASTVSLEAAMKHYERQLAKLEPLLATAPPDTWWNLGASYTLNRLGELKERTGAWAEAEPVFRHALDLRRRTMAAHPGSSREPRNVASTAVRLARTFIAQNRPAEASALWHSLLAELKLVPRSTGLEWRALVVTSILETIAALEPDAARQLAAATRAFLLLPGGDKLTAAETESLAALDKAAP